MAFQQKSRRQLQKVAKKKKRNILAKEIE